MTGNAPAAGARPRFWRRQWVRVSGYFTDQDPSFWVAFTPALVVAALIFVRSPASNYIFDEQEALLANPYVNGNGLGWLDAFRRDFWGLLPDRSIGSYRPIPNLIWRALWQVHKHPWLHHWINVVLHAVNAALFAGIVQTLTRRRSLSWLAGSTFVTAAVLTEAVTGVVGIADVLGGLGVLLAVAALRLPLFAAPFAVFVAAVLGLLSKESVIVAVPLVPCVALFAAPLWFPERPLRVLRAMFALVATAVALVAYTQFRRKFFPVELPAELARQLAVAEPLPLRALHAFLAWFRQPKLPQDPINNPLVDADTPHRVAGALGVYARGLGQVFFPWTLSGDYSFPEQPIPAKLVTPASVIGAAALVLAPLAGVGTWISALFSERRERRLAGGFEPAWSNGLTVRVLVAIALVWIPVAYFPHSNIPVLLPTVRAERFWYLPALGTSLIVGVVLAALFSARPSRARLGLFLALAFFGFQATRARLHALDYTDDLSFWRATARAAPNSAKAHLNYGVMLGARGKLDERLVENGRALELAPSWPMAHVYYGDTLCRLHRAEQGWRHYVRGFDLAPNDPNLIGLGLQCLWDEKIIPKHESELLDMAGRHTSSWLAYLATEIVYNGEKNGGVEKKYRPRGYDEGPKQ